MSSRFNFCGESFPHLDLKIAMSDSGTRIDRSGNIGLGKVEKATR